jgi:hypothetical protein
VDIRIAAAGILWAFCALGQAGEREPVLGNIEAEALKRADLAPVRGNPVSIRVLPGDWGGAEREDVENLLISVARELWVYFPERSLKPILVAPTERNPVAGYSKGPDGEYFVYLSARGRHWSQYAYQFAHEFTHILSNYERNGNTQVRRNQWFDESLCETAALFTLRRLGATWLKGEGVPYPHWKPYGTALQSYVTNLLAQPHRAPAKSGFADWYRGNADALDKNPYLRERDEVVAGMLLPLFEEYPEAWSTIAYLNLQESDATGSFPQYLANWHYSTPERQRPLVARIIELFGFSVPGQAASRGAALGVPQSR